MKELEWSQHFKSSFAGAQRAANSVVGDRLWPKFELIQAFMVVLINCKNEEDPLKNEGAIVVKTFLQL